MMPVPVLHQRGGNHKIWGQNSQIHIFIVYWYNQGGRARIGRGNYHRKATSKAGSHWVMYSYSRGGCSLY